MSVKRFYFSRFPIDLLYILLIKSDITMNDFDLPQTADRYSVMEITERSEDLIVLKVIDKVGNICVCKVFNKVNLERKHAYENFLQRLSILKHLNHPNIPRVMSVQEYGPYVYVFTDQFQNGNAKDYLMCNGKMSSDEVFTIMTQLLSALKFAHSLGLFHGHITLESIMFDLNMVPKITGFHLGVDNYTSAVQTQNDNTYYSAPEELKMMANDYFALDIWHLGVCLYTLSTSNYPFAETNQAKLCQNILRNEPNYNGIAINLAKKLQLMLLKDPKARPSASQLLSQDIDHKKVSLFYKPNTTTLTFRTVQPQQRIQEMTRTTSVNYRRNMHPSYFELPKIEKP